MLQRQCQCLQDFEDCTAQDFCLRLLLLLCADCWQPTAGSRLLAADCWAQTVFGCSILLLQQTNRLMS